MKTYIYPENLRATVKLWFWNVRDFIIICTGVVISVMIFAKLWTPVPMAFTICHAFITLRGCAEIPSRFYAALSDTSA